MTIDSSENEHTEDEDSLPLSALDSSISSTLNSLCLEYRRIGAEIAERTKTQLTLKECIEEIALQLPSKRIKSESWTTVKSQKVTYPLQKRLLIQECHKHDIDPITVLDIIKASSPAKKGKEYISIIDPNQKGQKGQRGKEYNSQNQKGESKGKEQNSIDSIDSETDAFD